MKRETKDSIRYVAQMVGFAFVVAVAIVLDVIWAIAEELHGPLLPAWMYYF